MKRNVFALVLAIVAVTCLFPAPASSEAEMFELPTAEPTVIDTDGEEVGHRTVLNNKEVLLLSDGQVLDPDDFPEVDFFGFLDPGEFQVALIADSHFRIAGDITATLTKNGQPAWKGTFQLAQFNTSQQRRFASAKSGASYQDILLSLTEGSVYELTLLIPYRDTELSIRYTTGEFKPQRYNFWARYCVSSGQVNFELFVVSLGRLPGHLWISADGRTENRVRTSELEPSFGFAEFSISLNQYQNRRLLDLRFPDGTEGGVLLFNNPPRCGNEGPGGGMG